MSEKALYYVNAVELEVGLFDFVLKMGVKKDRHNPGTTPEDIDLIANMSPQYAKALANVLTDAVAQYEAKYGELKLDMKVEASESTPKSTVE